MKTLLFIITFFFASHCIAQNTSDRIQKYYYSTYQDKDLIKIKTDTYLIDLKRSGFIITKNEIQSYYYDIDIELRSERSSAKANVTYAFLDDHYIVSFWSPKLYMPNTKKWIDLTEDEPSMKNVIDMFKDIVFKKYQNEVNSDF